MSSEDGVICFDREGMGGGRGLLTSVLPLLSWFCPAFDRPSILRASPLPPAWRHRACRRCCRRHWQLCLVSDFFFFFLIHFFLSLFLSVSFFLYSSCYDVPCVQLSGSFNCYCCRRRPAIDYRLLVVGCVHSRQSIDKWAEFILCT